MNWRVADRLTITRILRNPAYAGIYVYGKTEADHTREPYRNGHRRRLIRGAGQRIHKGDHHEPYVAPNLWTDIQRRMTENRNKERPSAGKGEPLVQGLLRCTVHNMTFGMVYNNRALCSERLGSQRLGSYRCNGPAHLLGAHCAQAAAVLVDRLVESELLKALIPPSLDDVNEAAHKELREYEALERARQDELRRAEQALAEIERDLDQFGHDYPDYKPRLLERASAATRRVNEIKASHLLNPLTPPLRLEEPALDEIRELLGDLRRLWRHPNVSAQQRKAIVRTAIRTIYVTPRPDAWTLEIEWVGGQRTFLELLTREGALAVMRREYEAGRTPAEISTVLAERGIVQRAGAAGRPYTPRIVRKWITKMALQSPFDEAARAHISARCAEGVHTSTISEELNARGIRHRFGKWTRGRVHATIAQLRRKGIIPPAVAPPDGRILALHRDGLLPREIVAQLRQEGVTTRGCRPLKRYAVYGALKRLGCRPNSLSGSERALQLLTTWVGTCTTQEMASRLNSLRVRTLRGQKWTATIVRLRLEQVGLTQYARDLLDELLRQWSPALTLHDLSHRLNSLDIRTPRGHIWNEEYVRRHLFLLGLSYRRRRARPSRRSVTIGPDSESWRQTALWD